jgi:hypothetical protein
MMEYTDATKELILTWYYRSQRDYYDLYMQLYIAYNAWFKRVTHASNDREAIAKLKKRFVVWADYESGKVFQDLRPIMQEIVHETALRPLQTTQGMRYWDGTVVDVLDWRSLIEYWYRIRCGLFHGSKSPENVRDIKLVELAYKSLNIFMKEVVVRMEHSLDYSGGSVMSEFSSEMASLTADKSFARFINSYDLWNVDMESVR